MPELTLAVRDLVRFCHRRGDLDHRFNAGPSGVEGIRGHQSLYRQRPDSYRPEFPLEYRHSEGELSLLLRGRADGCDESLGLVEEIKTYRGSLDAIPEAVRAMHWAQGQLYAAMLLAGTQAEGLTVRVTWFEVDRAESHSEERWFDREQLQDFLTESLRAFSTWCLKLGRLRRARDDSIRQLDFPLGEFRAGQRDMAELVYKCIDQGGQLMLEAPTGIGKTSAVLFPALKALAAGKHERLLYTTARVVGRRAAEDTLAQFRHAGYRGGALTLSAKERICFSPGKACHAQDCPFAESYYDKLPGALEAAVDAAALTREVIEALAREFQLCPYQLGLDLLPWVDLVIADLHYAFSLTPLFGGSRDAAEARWSVLVDEAHNLPGRARGMYSARLAKRALMSARRQAPEELMRPLNRVNRALLALQKGAAWEGDFESRETLPEELLEALERLVAEFGDSLAGDPALLQRYPLCGDWYFDVLQFLRVAEQWGEEFRCELSRGRGKQGMSIALNCLDPSRLLAARQAEFRALVAFSATLSPAPWMRHGLGLQEGAVYRRLPSPFRRDQLSVQVATGVDTRYQHREASLPQLVATLEQWLAQGDGNAIVYFPSYRYLEDCLTLLPGRTQGETVWVQRPDMSDAEREELLALLAERRDVLAFCILGGIFGEGIDLPGEQLANVAVVGVGLPQVNRDTEQLRLYYQLHYAAGFEYAFLYPGMQKVDQALGRVIRRPEDRGRALLIDSRYGRAEYRDLLPPWWDYRPWKQP